MTCVHAAQSRRRNRSIGSGPSSSRTARSAISPRAQWADEARCERGVALVELGRLEEAERDLTAVAARHQVLLQLKAELALGKIHVARHDNDAAVRTFFKVAYGHGGPGRSGRRTIPGKPKRFSPPHRCSKTPAGKMPPANSTRNSSTNYPASPRTTLARQSLERILRR